MEDGHPTSYLKKKFICWNKNTLNFLADLFHKKLSYSAINSARSALSALSGDKAVGNDPKIKRLMKGIYIKNPALPKYNVTWDPDIILVFKKLAPM